MSRIIRLLIKNSLHQNKNREIRYLPDLSIVNLLSVFVLVQKFLNYYPNYPTHRIYFREVETPNCKMYYRIANNKYPHRKIAHKKNHKH